MPARAGRVTDPAIELCDKLRRWSRRSWAVPVEGGGSRGDAVFAVVQSLADLGAAAGGRPARPVPRQPDGTLGDQLAVMLHDVRETGDPAARERAEAEVTALAARLGFRP
jgi:hypothetical protein